MRGNSPLFVNFQANANDNDGNIVGYEWDFNGDNNYDTSTLDSTISYTYDTAGIYSAKVRVTDNDWASKIAVRNITVYSGGFESTVIKISAGNDHSLSIRSDGTLWAWGGNSEGQLGDSTNIDKNHPIQIGSDSSWVLISNDSSSSGIKTDGTLWAWGNNSVGQLGDSTYINKNYPVQIENDSNWVSISNGRHHSLGIKSDGILFAWGGNWFGELGDSTTTDKNYPIQIGNDSSWVSITSGEIHSLGIKTDGTLWAWGNNSVGQLGDSTTTDKSYPVQIGSDNNWVSIKAGYSSSLGIKSNGTIWAWGLNVSGQLGDSTYTNKNNPVQIGNDSSWVSVSTNTQHSLGIKTDGTLWAWGRNEQGQLGDSTNTDKNYPIQIGNDSSWVSISAGYFHSIGIKSNGTVWAWGFNYFGQLGDSTNTNKNYPVQIDVNQNQPPTVTLSANPSSGKSPLLVNFQTNAYDTDGVITNYEWDFDGDDSYDTSSSDSTISYTYDTVGEYTVKVRVTDDDSTTTVDSTVINVLPPNQPPVILLNVDYESGHVPLSVNFTASAYDTDGVIVSYEWDCDGNGSYDTSTTDSTLSYTYNTAGIYNAIVRVKDDDSATAIDIKVINVLKPNLSPVVLLNVDYESGHVPLSVNFTASAYDTDGVIVSYEWDFDGDDSYDTSSTDSTISYTYNTAGIYTAKLRVTDDDSSATIDSTIINVLPENQSPVVLLNVDYNSGVVPLSVNFTVNAYDTDGIIKNYEWDFDGDDSYDTSSTDSTISYTYDTVGTYTAKVRVTDDDSATTIDSTVINVLPENQSPVVLLNVDYDSGHVPLSVNFTANAYDTDGIIVSYEWDFDGNGSYNTSTMDSTLSYTYNTVGIYNAIVRVTDDDSATAIDIKVINVLVPNLSPVVLLNVDYDSGHIPLSVNFTANAYDTDGVVVNYEWDFDGDDSYDTSTTDSTISYTYNTLGLYTAKVRVTDDDSATAINSTVINALEANQLPVVLINVDYDSGHVPLSVNYTASAYDTDGVITNYEWDFDGDDSYDTSSTDSTISYTYNTAGTYTAKVRVTDNDSAATIDSTVINVLQENQPPVILLNVDYESGHVPLSVNFTANAYDTDGVILSYEWDFDGDDSYDTSSTDSTLSYTYNTAGIYNAKLRVTDDDSATVIDSTVINVLPENQSPVVSLNVDYDSGVVPLSVNFTANAYDTDGIITSYEWDFDGDDSYDTSSTDSTISYTYDTVGAYTAKVRVTDDDNAANTDSTTINVFLLSFSTPQTLASGLNYPYAIVVDSASVYWTEFNDGGAVKKTGINGGLVTTLASGVNSPYSIAVDSTDVFWTDRNGGNGAINKVDINGGSVTTIVSDITSPLRGIAIDSTNVYWVEYNNPGAVKKVGKNGGPVTTLASGLNGPFGIAIDSTCVYWTELGSGFIKKVGINGGSVTTLASGLNGPIHIAVDSMNVYWTEGYDGSIKKVEINGGSVTSIASGLHSPFGLAIDSTSVYWTELGTEIVRTVMKAGKDGGLVTTLASTSVNDPLCISVDSNNAYWTETKNGTGTSDIGNGSVMVVSKGKTILVPIVNLTANYDSGYVPLSVNFTASAYDTDGVIVSYEWDFDGNNSYDTSTTDSTISYIYNTVGIFNAKVRVTDNDSATAEDITAITILVPPNQMPIAEAGSDKSGLAGQIINFNGSGSSDPDGTIISYDWNFGDGNTNGGVSVSHSYDSMGVYTVTLTVTDNDGAPDEDSCMVTINVKPDILSVVPNSGYNNTSTPITINGSNFDTTCRVYIWSDSSCAAGKADTPGYASGVFVSGNYAYIADDSTGIQIVNMSDPLNPSIISSIETPGYASNVFVSNDYAYVADYDAGLQVIDITNPSSPSIAGSADLPGFAYGVYVSGNYAYVACDTTGLQIVDISDPLNPNLAGSVATFDVANAACVSGNYVYVADGQSGIQVIDISDTSNYHIVKNVDTQGFASDIQISGNYAFIANGGYGLKVIDVSNPPNSFVASSLVMPELVSWVSSIYIIGNYAYLTNDWAMIGPPKNTDLLVIDISNPLVPRLISNVDISNPYTSWDVFISGDYIYLAAWDAGLQILHKLSSGTRCDPVNYINGNTLVAQVPKSLNKGKYRIKVSNSSGEEDLLNDAFTVLEINKPPVVTLTANPNSGNAPLFISLIADAADPDGGVVKYEWDFDGNGLYDLNTVDNIINHTYNAPANYNSKVRVTDNNGATAEATTIVKVTTQISGNIDSTSPGSSDRVDGYDLFVFAKAFGSKSGDQNWNPSADINNDLIVDGNDLVILAGNFGKQ